MMDVLEIFFWWASSWGSLKGRNTSFESFFNKIKGSRKILKANKLRNILRPLKRLKMKENLQGKAVLLSSKTCFPQSFAVILKVIFHAPKITQHKIMQIDSIHRLT